MCWVQYEMENVALRSEYSATLGAGKFLLVVEPFLPIHHASQISRSPALHEASCG
jgi:hypothetical protein